jgi:MYXO-CTERM domain-containing protein
MERTAAMCLNRCVEPARHLRCLSAAFAAAAALSLMPAQAWACSCSLGGLSLSQPADGATAVPINAEIKLHVDRMLPSDTFSLTGPDGEPVPFNSRLENPEYVRIRPLEDLAPHSRFTLTFTGVDPHQPAEKKIEFETGATRDEGAPFNGPLPTFHRKDERGDPFFLSSCEPFVGYEVNLPEGSDDVSAPEDVWYHLYVGRDPDSIDLTRVTALLFPGEYWLGRSTCYDSPWPSDDDPPALRLAAVDLAGNEAEPTGPIVPGSCGCGSSRSGTAPVVLLFLLLVALRRRSWNHAG